MTPHRTCVACGARDAQDALMRFVRAGEALHLDAGRRAPGRGGYLHRSVGCHERFARSRGVIRSLRWAPDAAARAALLAAMARSEAR